MQPVYHGKTQSIQEKKCFCNFDKQSPSIILGSSFLQFRKQEVTYTRRIAHCCFKDLHPVMFLSVYFNPERHPDIITLRPTQHNQ